MQWRHPELIQRYQLEALRALLMHAQRAVPYYRETFARVGFDPRSVQNSADLAALPVLTREIIRERYRDLLDPARTPHNIHKATSGSTAAPLQFEYCVDSESWRNAARIRGYSWSGYRPGLPVFFYWGMSGPLPPGMRGAKIRLDRAMRRETFVDSMKQDEASRRSALARLRRTRPSFVVCYTQSCAQFARWILDTGSRDWDDIPVLCGAEAVLPADRAVLSRAFGPHIYETYGSRETMLMAAECSEHAGMHLAEENVLVEVAHDGRPVATGDSGDVLVTDLHNYGMPFIRYQNGDMATMGPNAPCACGRGLRRLARVDGRRADTLRDREGNPIPGLVFHVLFADSKQDMVRQFQAVQRAHGEVLLKVVRGQQWSSEHFETLVRRFQQYLRGLPLTVEFHETIPPAPNGKLRTIVVEG
jgi:phenylacetate-CoA ligase